MPFARRGKKTLLLVFVREIGLLGRTISYSVIVKINPLIKHHKLSMNAA